MAASTRVSRRTIEQDLPAWYQGPASFYQPAMEAIHRMQSRVEGSQPIARDPIVHLTIDHRRLLLVLTGDHRCGDDARALRCLREELLGVLPATIAIELAIVDPSPLG